MVIRSAPRLLLSGTRPLPLYPQIILLRRRRFADQPQSSPARYQPDLDSAENVQNEFAGHAMSAFRDMRKVMLYLAYGTLIIGTVTGVAFEAAHFWIERQMRARADDETRRWGWEAGSWSDIKTGGTSPELGFLGRHAVRAAWFSLRYGQYFAAPATISQVGGGRAEEGSLNIVDASLESARIYLEKAMASLRDKQGRVRMDSVGLELLERHAAVMERFGTQSALLKASEEYTQVFHGRAEQRLAQARLAVKLGDLSERLGDGDNALSWWTRSVDLTKDEVYASKSTSFKAHPAESSSALAQDISHTISGNSVVKTHSLPSYPPSAPLAQRTLVSAMLSLSAYYSKKNQLQEAQDIQEYAMRLIDAMVPRPEASSLAIRVEHSPAQTLHRMYLLHRKSLLSLHHGEVTFALASSKKKAGTSAHTAALMDFLTAASSTEAVAHILSGQSLSHPDIPSSYLTKTDVTSMPRTPQYIPHPPSSDSPLLTAYRDSPAMRAPAGSLLRDSRLAAAEAWDLCGMLYGELGGAEADVKALECFERALGWAGDDPAATGSREGIGASEWQALWARFVQAREKVLMRRSR